MKKTLMYVANRIWLILTIYVGSVLLAAATFAHLEAKSFGDGLWWATVTALTIGYGDLTPATSAGRVAGVFFGHFWIFVVIPMIIANIVIHLIDDKNLFSDEEQREMMERLRNVDTRLSDDYHPARRAGDVRTKPELSQPPTPPDPPVDRASETMRAPVGNERPRGD